MKNTKTALPTALAIVCIILVIALAATVACYAKSLDDKDRQIDELSTQIADLTDQITDLNTQITALNNQILTLQNQTSQNQTTQPPIQETIRGSTLNYIKLKHPETEQFMQAFNWTGGRTTPNGILGAETYTYQSNGWTITITYPVIPNPTYNITADYSAPGIGIPYRVIWQGIYQNQTIKETSYTLAQ
jgi:TolA-binding protein